MPRLVSALQMDMKLASRMSLDTLVTVLRDNAWDHQRAAVRLLQSLSCRGFSQGKIAAHSSEIISHVSRLLTEYDSNLIAHSLTFPLDSRAPVQKCTVCTSKLVL